MSYLRMSYLRIPVYPLTEHSYLPFDPDDLPERFKAMKGQETNAYKVEDYLNPYYAYEAPELITSDVESDAESDAESATSLPNCSAAGINNDWRSKICEWLFQVVDYFNYDREIVAVSMNYLDRYLCKRPVNKRTFQLLAMASLYMASKLHRQYNSSRLRMSSLIEVGREYFTEEHVTAMEESILDELGWQLRPPTPLAFVKTYVLLLNPSVCKPTVKMRLWIGLLRVCMSSFSTSFIPHVFEPATYYSSAHTAHQRLEGLDI